MKNRNLPPYFKLAEFVRVEKTKQKKDAADRRSHQGRRRFYVLFI